MKSIKNSIAAFVTFATLTVSNNAFAATTYVDNRSVIGFSPMYPVTTTFRDYLLGVTSFMFDQKTLNYSFSAITQGRGAVRVMNDKIIFDYRSARFIFSPYKIYWDTKSTPLSGVAWTFKVSEQSPHPLSRKMLEEIAGMTPWYRKVGMNPISSMITILNLALFRGMAANEPPKPYPSYFGSVEVDAFNTRGDGLAFGAGLNWSAWTLDNQIVSKSAKEPSPQFSLDWLIGTIPTHR